MSGGDPVRLLRPTVWFARVCGACPCPLSRPHRWLCAALCVAGTVAVCDAYASHRTPAHDITAFLLAGSWLSLLLHLYTALGTALLTGRRLARFFALVESARRTLFSLDVRQPAAPSRRSQLAWLAWLASPTALCALWWAARRTRSWLPGLGLALLVSHARLGLLRAALRLVDAKFASLNWHLDDRNSRWPLFLPRPADVTFGEFACVDAFRRAQFVRYGPDARALTVAGVAASDLAHFRLGRAVRTLDSAFSCDLLTLTCQAALLTACGSFRALGSFDPPPLRPLWLFVTLHHAASFLAILLYATGIDERSRQTALLVHDLLDEEERHSAGVRDKLAEFSQALLHRRANFTAAGFFNMDLRLISRLASVLAPVTLFLVQNDNRPRATPPPPPPSDSTR